MYALGCTQHRSLQWALLAVQGCYMPCTWAPTLFLPCQCLSCWCPVALHMGRGSISSCLPASVASLLCLVTSGNIPHSSFSAVRGLSGSWEQFVRSSCGMTPRMSSGKCPSSGLHYSKSWDVTCSHNIWVQSTSGPVHQNFPWEWQCSLN